MDNLIDKTQYLLNFIPVFQFEIDKHYTCTGTIQNKTIIIVSADKPIVLDALA